MAKKPKRIIITGEKQSGKSTLATHLALFLQQQHLTVSGFIARGLWQGNTRTGFDLVDLETGKVFDLARRNPFAGREEPTGFRFMEPGISAGTAALEKALHQSSDVLFIDEIGKLEIDGLGWSSWLTPALGALTSIHIWIVRSAFVKTVCRIWECDPTVIVSTGENNAMSKLETICTRWME
ncbi:MAG TPA: nucleoside-triphosphatase [Desulfobacteraceae bacterium]|nr:nucleoside-triphosphatase [Desulfobacteraceae bacterium]